MRFRYLFIVLTLLACYHANNVFAETGYAANEPSFHLGLIHPNGGDLAGYSVEKRYSNHLYTYYNFGFPSLAAAGFSYYENRKGDGITAAAGVGIGLIMYGSVAYQWKVERQQYIKIGAGLGAGLAYSGLFTVISYEYRLKN